ncbi:MAG: hypothetical protein ABIT58_00755, partial [Ferruginibacter sp.]
RISSLEFPLIDFAIISLYFLKLFVLPTMPDVAPFSLIVNMQKTFVMVEVSWQKDPLAKKVTLLHPLNLSLL